MFNGFWGLGFIGFRVYGQASLTNPLHTAGELSESDYASCKLQALGA